MLYRILGEVNSGTSTTALDRIVNSKYDNPLYLTNEISEKKVLERLKNYQDNTKKIIVNNIKVKAIAFGDVTDDALELLLQQAVENGHDGVVLDRLEGIICADGACVISPSVYYDDLCERLASFSKENNIDIIVVQQLQRDYSGKVFDEAMENVGKLDLPDDQEFILAFRSNLDNGTPFVKIYERRNNLIRNFNLTQYFPKTEDVEANKGT
jgi:hypothetical protein